MDKQRVRKWEVDGVTPDDVSQSYIGEVLGVPAEDVDPAMWPDWLPAADGGVIPLGPASTVPALREAMTTTMNRSRRSFMTAIAGTSLITLAGAWASADTQAHAVEQARVSKSVDEEVVTFLEETSARLTTMATEHRQHVAPLLDAHLTTVANLIAEGRCTRPVKVRLLALAANLSQTVAWHRFDLGLHIEASKYWVAGLHCAHQGGDRDMAAALLSDLAYQASWQDNPRTASGILERALSRTRHPAARSLLQLRLARALAAQGERKGTFRALAAAEHLLDAACGEPVPAWCAWFSEADLAVDSGQCLRDLGDTRRAHELIREGHSLLPPSRDKTRGIFLLYQAQNHLDVGEPDLAAAAGLESLLLAQRIGAPRCVQLVRELIPRFEGYREIQGVPELLDRVAA
ncbi:XRE family transcriptional regulator [Streptomyces lydicus]|uniref:XRE family transcriptional regulator n=1 Tax=Streptomyces lydicus TaxID=47763 RepID=UPI0036EE1B30